MREAVIELKASDIGIEMGVIVSREENVSSYDDVKDLPGFYTRVSKSENRTVYLSMTDKMTMSMIDTGNSIGVDGSKSDPLTQAPELMHPNTKYYVHIYYKQGGLDSNASTTKIEFTTEDYPTAFPTANEAGKNGATWSSVYSHTDDVVVEYKADETYCLPIRAFYYNDTRSVVVSHGTIRTNYLIDYTTKNKFAELGISDTETLRIYDIHNISGSPTIPLVGTDKNPIWDLMAIALKVQTKYTFDFFQLDDSLAYSTFSITNGDIFKNKLVNE
jgi:hypothetical protein